MGYFPKLILYCFQSMTQGLQGEDTHFLDYINDYFTFWSPVRVHGFVFTNVSC